MPVINKTVDKILVNGSEIFIYTFNVSYSGLTQPAQDGKLVDFFPSEIIYQLPPIGGQLVSITPVTVPGGTNVEFNFGPVNAGTSITFTVSCEFGPGRSNGDTFTNTAKLYADDVLVQTGSARMVTLNLTGRFELLKTPEISSPVTPGQVVTFMLDLQNKGDEGAEITNISINDILPATLIPVTSFLPVGNDSGMSQYSDTRYNGRTGTWSGNTLNFTLPSYKGVEYKILFKATVASDVIPGSRITNTANWTIEGSQMTPATTTFTVYESKASAELIKGGPQYATIEREILYYVLGKNTGTVNLNDFIMTDIVPKEVDIKQIAFKFGGTLPEKYSLYIETSNAVGTYIPIATDLSQDSSVIDLAPFIPSGSRLLSARAVISTVTPSNVGNWLYLYGIVNNTATLNQVITNNANYTATSTLGNITGISSANTTLNGKSVLNIRKLILPQLSAYYPLNEFMINLATSTSTSMSVDPVFSDLLPLGIAYVPNNYYYVFTDIFSGKTYDSRNPGFPITNPVPEIIKNYNGTGRTLVRVSFNNFILQLFSTVQVFFPVIVELNPPTSFTNTGYLGNPGNNAIVDGTPYTDALDLDGDTITAEEIAQSNSITSAILTTSEFSLEKWVKGNLDSNFSKAGFTTAGGKILYNLNVTNNQNVNLKNIDMVDILPYVGDTGVILNTIPRGSQFDVYATKVVTAKIINVLGEAVDPNPDITIEYSTSKDPIRFDQTGTSTIGTGTWSTVAPIDITTIHAIRVTTGTTVILKPYERLVVEINAVAPIGTQLSKLAYNSFAVKADQVTNAGVTTPMNPAEPNKVSVQIGAATNGSIGNFVWNDLNKNGLYDAGEPGVNGIKVELYDQNNNLLQTTTTANDFLNNPGYYSFTNLEAGNYYVKFIPYSPYNLTIQKANVANGSKPNQTTGITDLITLTNNQSIITVNAGVVENTINDGSIGNFVWNDLNKNGLYDAGEPGVNGIKVELYDQNNHLLQTTTTANDSLNNPGYYNFINLAAGNYYVKFIPDTAHNLTIQQANVANGSKPNQTTGITNLITLAQSQVVTTIIAGLETKQCNPPVINASDKKILLGTTFDPLAGVSATDCLGDDITSSIIITANDVDTTKVGVYHVTYSVTDKNGQTTIKTITVIVYTVGPRDQAINDIIESVALVQTALSHIINAEGEKIQKAIEIKATDNELIAINNSVNEMISSITSLETILEGKLETFNCEYCNK
ncbi:MAG: SdrD B-like domain-containing protein [Clostridia bacterium]